MVSGPSISRPPPRRVAPVELNGVRYEQVLDAEDLDRDSQTGWMRATEIATGRVLWTRQVYRQDYDSRMERDVQERYFTELSVAPDGGTILVTNEAGLRLRVDPATGESTPAE